MPHVLIEGPCNIRELWERFEPEVRRDGDRIVKSIQSYLAPDGDTVLVECTVIEGFLQQHFLAQIVRREGETLVRIFHGSHPERTEGVRSCLGWLAARLIDRNPGCRWGKDNLGLTPNRFRPPG